MIRLLVAVALMAAVLPSAATAAFSFADVVSLDDMLGALELSAPLGASRDSVRAMLVEEGGAKLYAHPDQQGVEKYVLDINLCRLHVFRWNISANFDGNRRLTQIFVNGEMVHARGDAEAEPGSRPRGAEAIFEVKAPRPQASQGENVVSYILYDLDVRTDVVSDQFVNGGGPTRADPSNMGRLKVYAVEHWRSIFHDEDAPLVNHAGPCP